MKIENNVMLNAYGTTIAPVRVMKTAETAPEGGFEKNKQNSELRYSGDRFSKVNTSTEIYADNIIKEALKNIKSGERVEESKRAIQIFASIVKADPTKIIYG